VPAAAVIPAPIAYIKVVAVKKLVVGSRGEGGSVRRNFIGALPARPPPPSGPPSPSLTGRGLLLGVSAHEEGGRGARGGEGRESATAFASSVLSSFPIPPPPFLRGPGSFTLKKSECSKRTISTVIEYISMG
jgi:hypothetical protein